jgi:hypothetical protein
MRHIKDSSYDERIIIRQTISLLSNHATESYAQGCLKKAE